MEKKAWKHYGTRGKKRTSFSFRAICIAFIFFTILGCVIALFWQQGQDDTMGEMITRAQQPQSFWWVFQKYAKYLALLFLGGECLGGTEYRLFHIPRMPLLPSPRLPLQTAAR